MSRIFFFHVTISLVKIDVGLFLNRFCFTGTLMCDIGDHHTEKQQRLMYAIVANRVDAVERVLMENVQISPTMHPSVSPLRIACLLPGAEILCLLLSWCVNGVNEVKPNATAGTLAMYIVMYGKRVHLRAILALIDVNLGFKNKNGDNVLDMAAKRDANMYHILALHVRARRTTGL
jgi:hypothetical protein